MKINELINEIETLKIKVHELNGTNSMTEKIKAEYLERIKNQEKTIQKQIDEIDDLNKCLENKSIDLKMAQEEIKKMEKETLKNKQYHFEEEIKNLKEDFESKEM